MKKLVMIFVVAFTMGLAASSVSAENKDAKKKETAACCSQAGAKRGTCTKATCTKDAKATKATKAETPATAPVK